MDERALSHGLRLEDLEWLGRLAHRLVRDPHLADDAVQETVVAALTRRPRRLANPRAWLGSVLRNAVRQERRGRARRADREVRSKRGDETAPPTLDVVEELALHRKLVDCVHALDEPYRSVLVRRFLRGEPPRAIARDEGVPVKTVHTRIERGLARLRERLDREWGGERAHWVLALLPLARVERATAGAGLGALWIPMNVKLIVAAGLVTAGALLLPPLFREDAPATGAELAGARSAAPAGLPDGSRTPPSPSALPAPARAPVAAAQFPRADAGDGAVAGFLVRGFARELDGRDVGDVDVVFERRVDGAFVRDESVAAVRTTADGAFELALAGDPGAGRVNVRSARYTAVARPHWSAARAEDGADPLVVVLAVRKTYGGRVVDEGGAPVASATVQVALEGSFFRPFEAGGHSAHLLNPLASGSTNEHGEYLLDGAAFVEGAILAAHRDGYEPAQRPLPSETALDVELVLRPRAFDERTLYGAVFDSAGTPVHDAAVSLGWGSVRTDEAGGFALELEAWQDEGTLRAVRAGRGAASRVYRWADGEGRTPRDRVRLFLADGALAIEGRVVDPDGAPVAGAIVWTPDTTYFGQASQKRGERTVAGLAAVEKLALGVPATGPDAMSLAARTDDDGRFRLAGLLERDYTVLALDGSSLARTEPELVRAGERVVLRLVREEWRPVAGRVVSRGGLPLAGVRLTPGREPGQPLAFERPDTSWVGSPLRPPGLAMTHERAAVVTDADGRFAFPPIATEGTFLDLAGEGIHLGHRFRLAEAPDFDEVVVAVDARCRFRVVSVDPDAVDGFERVDAEGELQPLYVEVEARTISTGRVEVLAGRSDVVALEEGEHRLVFFRGGQEVGRRTVTLSPGGIAEVRP